jgi:hypothetical protein
MILAQSINIDPQGDRFSMMINKQQPFPIVYPMLQNRLQTIQNRQMIYLLMSLFFLTLALMSCATVDNHIPSFIKIDNQSIQVNQSFELSITASDLDEDDLNFSFEITPQTTINQNNVGRPQIRKISNQSAIFSWTPSIADAGNGIENYRVRFVVTDPQNASDEEVISIQVKSTQMTQSLSLIAPIQETHILDLNQNRSSFSIPIVVECANAPTNRVDLSISQGPMSSSLAEYEDANLNLTSSQKSYIFEWTPSQDEIDQQNTYTVTLLLSATPEYQQAIIQKRLLLKIIPRSQINLSNQDCQGEPINLPASIQETETLLPSQLNNQEAVSVAVHVADAEVSSPFQLSVSLLYLISKDASLMQIESSLLSISPLSFLREENGAYLFTTTLDLADAEDQSTLYYQVQVIDQDPNAERNCDQVTTFPNENLFFKSLMTQASSSQNNSHSSYDACRQSNTCPNNQQCMSLIAGQDPSAFGGSCLKACLLDQDCREGESCKLFEDYSSYCATNGSQNENQTCRSFSDCAQALICMMDQGGTCHAQQ